MAHSNLYLLILLLQSLPVSAQYVVSSTAAWSSQIIAFWGAIIIASQVGRVAGAGTALFSSIRLALRIRAITNALARGNWFLHSGWVTNTLRTDIAVVCWRSPEDLQGLIRRVAMQIESLGAGEWQVLVVGCQLEEEPSKESKVHWIRCPRGENLCGARIKATDGYLFPLSNEDLDYAVAMLEQSPPASMEDIVHEMEARREKRPSRVSYLSEQPQEAQMNATKLSWGYIFTSVEHHITPFLKLKKWTSSYGADRGSTMVCATRMYLLVHLLISCAVGLMAAATGRGLAVWFMTVRPTLSTMGGKNVNGNDILQSLLCTDETVFQYETGENSLLLAGDVLGHPLQWWAAALVFAVPAFETAVITAGWLYGSLKADRLAPSGLVGHGMLWLSIVVGLSLCIRSLFTLRNQGKGRLVGIWHKQQFPQHLVGMESLEVSTSDLVRLAGDVSPIGLVVKLLQGKDPANIPVVESFFRLPVTGVIIEYLVATQIMKYKYQGDEILTRGDKPISPKSESPWRQSYCCVALTMACACVSAVYAYYPLPKWVKIITEVLLAISASWFNSLDLVGSFMHEKETSICFMVATLVVSSVWYVGLDNVG
ncbi:uncharacterized protein ACLA_003970 [Aspergillus clavatus NRRL 1]|uniref:Integral membrane protein n=1 Tax=Aspergillus clavatus (strain ATCC 1007 / CBS 513.65 / DSM 816 / NCTC 3887 / NRRL 1 / QM 1276 / 107) TaxID=344612 RepID=A1C5L6_ASPCL|nr:uncharacterized protein ACLA_003970 [Aspergillus clavatus NRRL 1]EAW14984.1 integral membrane protein [Aspergillus clavatus NRRL 1]